MRSFISIAVLGFSLLLLALPGARCEAKHQLKPDVVDAFKMFGYFDYAVAMFDADLDGDLDCLTAIRTELDENGPTATYLWIQPGLNAKEKKNITFHVRKGSTPDKPVLTAGDDGPELTANIIYTDYKTCAVLEFPFQSRQECMLWATKEAKDNVPENCVEQFEDNCDVKNMSYDQESCSQVIT